ncbi:Glutathione reductase [Candidatus Terasakiella magnetica]|uniref:Glutathione reductase n=1 Tax=Candidatus Terasakiella magnetica TaxID=1867952 RepID=A0A1C3RLY8_9PROT|nr:glutathione-disulfide reductase [Candidatus Terasakiella magnetica]SCA58300.1 Glutathione reductase [Candidatus Terasakiella magnetica]
MSQYDYDLLTIGAGSGGVRASRMAAQKGKRVAVCEEDRVGGTCVLRGCVPKKLLVYASEYSSAFEDSQGFGWSAVNSKIDWPQLIDTKNRELTRLNGIYNNILSSNGVETIEGRGTLIDEHTVEVAGKRYTAEKIIIAVGGWPTLPDVPGIEHAITSNEALDLPELPRRIVIVGGGYIAVEFAGIFAGMGSEVTEIIRADRILRGFDDDLRSELEREMTKRGINIMGSTTVQCITKKDNHYEIVLGDGETIETDAIMYATGRKPKINGLGLEQAGVEISDKGAIKVDDNYKTSVDSIYAIGDVTDRVCLTPVALAEGMALVEHLFGADNKAVDYDNIASAVFSQPPLGVVGLTEAQARERYGKIDVYTSGFKAMKHTLSGRDERTFMKLIVEPESDKVIGAHMMGPDAAEIMQGIGIAMKCGATKAQFDATIGIHPSAAEEFVTMREKRPDTE